MSRKLLILDEPSDGVDPVGRKQIRDILNGLEQKGVTIFLNSHLLQEVELFCRDVAIIYQRQSRAGGQRQRADGGRRVSAVEAEPDAGQPEQPNCGRAHGGCGAATAHVSFLFGTREEANEAVDLLRAEHCEMESLVRASSSLEEVFIRTVEQK